MKHPTSPCTAYCHGRCVGCRPACEAWQKYEAEMAEFQASKRDGVYKGNMTVGRKKMVERMKKG